MKSRERVKRNQQSRQAQPQISAAIEEHLRRLGAGDLFTSEDTNQGRAECGCAAEFCLQPAGPLLEEKANSGC
jgi:hypothetical protein